MTDSIFNRIQVEIKKTYYVHTRYKINATFAMMYHEKPLNVVDLAKFLRISDHFIELDEHHYFITFAHTEQNHAFKASQNLLVYLDKHFNDRSTYIAVDSFNPSNSCKIVVNRLMEILQITRENSYSRIEDENILNEII